MPSLSRTCFDEHSDDEGLKLALACLLKVREYAT